MKFKDLCGLIDMENGFYVKVVQLVNHERYEELSESFFQSSDDYYESETLNEYLGNKELMFITTDNKNHLVVYVK